MNELPITSGQISLKQDVGYRFDDSVDPKTGRKRHLHLLDGKPLTGVTTVLGMIARPKLVPWASRMAVEYIRNNAEHVKVPEPKPDDPPAMKVMKDKILVTEELLKEAQDAHRRKRDSAADVGTIAHGMIEAWIKSGCPEFTAPEGMDSGVVRILTNFHNWAKRNNIKFLASEKDLYSRKMWVGGIMDLVIEKDGKKYIGDIKTSSGIYDRTPFFQCAAYRYMLMEMLWECWEDVAPLVAGGVHGSCIINLKKDGSFNERKDVHWSYDYQTDFSGFRSALNLYRMSQTFSTKKSATI